MDNLVSRIVPLLGTVLAVALAGPAMATDLSCQPVNPDVTWDGPVTVTLDEAAGAATVHWPGYASPCFQGSCPPHQNGWVATSPSASFSSDEIKFSAPNDAGWQEDYTFNRVSGLMMVNLPHYGSSRRFQCSVARRQF